MAANPSDLPIEALAKADPATVAALVEAIQEQRREQARAAFYKALSDFQGEVPPIPKRQTAQLGKYSYTFADLGTIWQTIAPSLARHGLAVSFDPTATDGGYLVTCRVGHEAGHHIAAHFLVPLEAGAGRNAVQAVGSALTYGRRYALTAALGLATADADTDAADLPAHEEPRRRESQRQEAIITPSQHKRLEARIAELGLDRERVKAWVRKAWRVEHLNALPRSRYDELDRRLEEWAASMSQEEPNHANHQ